VELPEAFKHDLQRGLDVIANRSDSLNRFLQNYARFSRLPPPTPRLTLLNKIVSEAVALETRLPIVVLPGPNVKIFVDPDQLAQVLINLLRNAVESAIENPAQASESDPVSVAWRVEGRGLLLWIRDRGIGLPETQNLFVPFYTTKNTGSGIGLVLSRQIIESHSGYLALQNRQDGPGCEAFIKLPLCVVEDMDQAGSTKHGRQDADSSLMG
jgi:nitrogen fixation/metabolism regulation signal transduction histidine kinase